MYQYLLGAPAAATTVGVGRSGAGATDNVRHRGLLPAGRTANCLTRTMSERIAHRGPDAEGLHCFADGSVSSNSLTGDCPLSISARMQSALVKDGLTLHTTASCTTTGRSGQNSWAADVRFSTSSTPRWSLKPGAVGVEKPCSVPGDVCFCPARREERPALLARDQMGIKPLYYLEREGGVIFASELKAIVAAVGTELRVEPASLVASILYYWVPDQRCSLHGVKKLQPGS